MSSKNVRLPEKAPVPSRISPSSPMKSTPPTPTASAAPTTDSNDPQKSSPQSDLFYSIPKEILSTIHTWKVKSGVVLRSSQMQATSRMHRFKVIQINIEINNI
jgi:hypothetical protein